VTATLSPARSSRTTPSAATHRPQPVLPSSPARSQTGTKLSEQQVKVLRSALTPRMTKYIPHKPTPKQAAFLLLPVREAFYGGAAGGGKSDALLMAALQYVDMPGYSAILFRRTFSDLALPGALLERSTEWLKPTDAKWDDNKKTWHFPSGATLTFGYLEHENDKYRYQSSEFNFIGFDELTQFTESQYRYLFSRLRRLKGSEVPLRMRAASNPGGEGHEWVRASAALISRPSARAGGRRRAGRWPSRSAPG